MSDFSLACDYQVVLLIPVGVYTENPATYIISSSETIILLVGFGDYMMKPVRPHIPRTAGDFGGRVVCLNLF